jgi:hypothetical protein
MADCICGGRNPNCSRCGGRGAPDGFAPKRKTGSSMDNFRRELQAIVDRPGTRALRRASAGQTFKTTTKPTVICPNCGAEMGARNLARHLAERCPKLFQRAPKTTAKPVRVAAKPALPKKPKKKAKRRKPVEDTESRQGLFERSFLQGGLCDGRGR